jgi:hypothetical protein
MFRLFLSRLQALLKYRSKVKNVNSEFWDPKRLEKEVYLLQKYSVSSFLSYIQ